MALPPPNDRVKANDGGPRWRTATLKGGGPRDRRRTVQQVAEMFPGSARGARKQVQQKSGKDGHAQSAGR